MSAELESILNNAYNLHVSGKLKEAEAEYEKLLESGGGSLDVLNLYAQLKFALQDYDRALELFSKVYAQTGLEEVLSNIIKVYIKKCDFENALKTAENIKNAGADILRLKAQAYLCLNDFKNAAGAYHQIINNNKAQHSDFYNLSIAYFKMNNLPDALKYALEAYRLNGNDADILMHISNIYQNMQDVKNQLEYLLKAAQLQNDAEKLENAGILYKKLKDDKNALECFQAAVKLDPERKNSLLNIAHIFQNYDKNTAAQMYQELAEKFPDDSIILFQLYAVYRDMRNMKEAFNVSLKIIQKAPDRQDSYLYAAEALKAEGRYEEAFKMFQKAQALGADKADCDIQSAEIYSLLNQQDKAEEILQKYPHFRETNPVYAFMRLKERDLDNARDVMHKFLGSVSEEDDLDNKAAGAFYKLNLDKVYGINEYELKQYKTSSAKKSIERKKFYKQYDLYGKNFDNRRILVYSKDGAGDVLMFSRYIHILAEHTKDIILETPKPLYRIIKNSFPQFETIVEDGIQKKENFDYAVSWQQLLTVLKENSLMNIPYSDGYLTEPEGLAEEKGALDIFKGSEKKIGIFWMGSPGMLLQRAIKLKELEPLFKLPNSKIYSFQISDLDAESEELKKKLPLIDAAPYISDYADTAALLKNIDVLVTIDSSIANLAGAIGVKTFLLLPYASEWRWFRDENKTPWYKSVRLFRQKKPFEWKYPVERIVYELTI